MYQPCQLSISIYNNRHKRRICCRRLSLYDAIFAASGLASMQVAIMQGIQRSGEASIANLMVASGLERSVLSHQIRPLLYNELLAIVPGYGDQTAEQFALTEKGQHQLQHAEALWRDAQAGLAATLEPGEVSRLRSVDAMASTQAPAWDRCDVAA